MNTYKIEVTDTLGGEANYSWVARHTIRAKSMCGAVNAFSRQSGARWRKAYDTGDMARYDSASGLVCYFIEQVEA